MYQWNKIFKEHGKFFLKINKELPQIAKKFKNHKVKKILDLGCGTGRHALYLARQGFEVYGTDIAETGIKIARQWLKENNLKADFKIFNIYKKLPYADNFFDAVISTNALHHARIKDIRKAIKEIERILKPDGLIFINFRKRKFLDKWLKTGVIENIWEKHKTFYKVIAPRTYAPMTGQEKNLPHYLFNKSLITKEFTNFKNKKIWVEDNKRHYCLLGELKK